MAKIVEKKLVEEFIGNNKQFISIPIYQRNYDWDESDISKLIDDILDFYKIYKDESDENYYLGNLITREEDINENINMILIDGQQRVTTTLLILLALRNRGLVKDPKDISKLIGVLSNGKKIKLNRVDDEDVVRKLIENNIRGLKGADINTRMYKNYDFVDRYIKRKNIDANILLEALKRIVIVDVKVPKRNETKVFETVNSTGKRLKPADLIKAYILFNSYTFSEKDADDIEYEFEKSITRKFNDINELSNFYRFYIAIIGRKQLAKSGSISIFKQFKQLHKDYAYENIEEVRKMIGEVSYHATIYNAINNFNYTKPLNKLYKRVFDNNSKTYYPLVHYMCMEYVNDFEDEEQLEKVIRILAKLSLFRIMGSYPDKNISTTIITMFPDFLKYREDKSTTLDDFEDFMEIIFSSGKNYKIPNEDIIHKQMVVSNHYSENLTKTRTLLLAAEVFSNYHQNGTPIDISCKFDVEHVFPQSDKEWVKHKSLKKIRELTIVRNNIGNLTLLAKKLNIIASNSYFDIKKKHIISETLRLSHYFNDVKDWSEKEIKKRAIFISDIIYNHFNEGRETRYSDIPIKFESVIKNTKISTHKGASELEFEFKDFLEKLKDEIGNLEYKGLNLFTPRPQRWLDGRLKINGIPRAISIYIKGRGANRVVTLAYDGSQEWKAKNIDKFALEKEISKQFTGEFKFKPKENKWIN